MTPETCKHGVGVAPSGLYLDDEAAIFNGLRQGDFFQFRKA